MRNLSLSLSPSLSYIYIYINQFVAQFIHPSLQILLFYIQSILPIIFFFKCWSYFCLPFPKVSTWRIKEKIKKYYGYLDKTDFLGIAMEALPAAHQSILPDQPMRVTTNSATQYQSSHKSISLAPTHHHQNKVFS